MELRNINSCINCENLLRNFMCSKHKKTVEINNFCDSHTYSETITKESTCSNCSHYKMTSCSKPSEASDSMFCFDWQKQFLKYMKL